MATDPQQSAGHTLEEGGGARDEASEARPHLFLAIEADRPFAGGARYALSGVDEVILGRGDARGAWRAPGKWMSSTHARLLCIRGAWVLEDAGSRNGTYVDGERVQRRGLVDGDAFEAGHSIFLLRHALPTPPGTKDDLDTSELAALPAGLRTLVPSLAPRHGELERIARSEVPILLLGETGTGKEVFARAVHALSGRKGAFVAVNCGSLSPALVEGLLFGHIRGSFSGATRDELGFVRAADGGTLFLDEIGDFPAAAQPSLLRVLQEREVVPVGTSKPVPVELRVVAATHRDLDALVAQGTFRRDLLTRLDGFRQALPPLRDRIEDLGLIASDLLARRATGVAVSFTSAAARALVEHAWSGNVRELDQVIARAVVLAAGQPIDPSQLALPPQAGPSPHDRPLDEADAKLRAELDAALTRHAGNVTEVARAMGKARMQIQRWMKRFAIDPEVYRRARG
jgi:hypothetical protein